MNGKNIFFIFNGKGFKELKHIILNFNEIGDLGFVGISAFIKNSLNLEIFELINVWGNNKGFTTLVNCLKSWEKIQKIYFSKNKISKMGIDAIKKIGEELKNKGVIFFLDKIDGKKNEDIIDGVEFI